MNILLTDTITEREPNTKSKRFGAALLLAESCYLFSIRLSQTLMPRLVKMFFRSISKIRNLSTSS